MHKEKNWNDLSLVSKNIIEQCWISVSSDKPTKFKVAVGTTLYKEKVGLEHFQEVLDYQKYHPYFNVSVDSYNNVLHVSGACDFNTWDKLDHTPTKDSFSGIPKLGDVIYMTFQDSILEYEKVTVMNISKTKIEFSNGYNIPIKVFEESATISDFYYVSTPREFRQFFLFKETEHISSVYARQKLEMELEDVFDLEKMNNTQILELIEFLKEQKKH